MKAFIKSKLGVLFPKLIGGSSTTYFKSAFYGTYSAGVRCPWRFANLDNGGIAGRLRSMATLRRVARTGAVVRGFVARVKSGVNGLRKQTRGARPLIHT